MNWDYIAGFFDGEGNLHIHPLIKSNGKISYQILIRIYSSNEKILKMIQNFIGAGHIYVKKKTGVYEFTLSKKEDCKRFLLNIKDKIIMKKPQVNFVLDNFSFERINNNGFDLDQFRGFITRKNVKRVHHTLLDPPQLQDG